MKDDERLWTCIARCQICNKELNRAKHVPEHEKVQVIISAPLVAVCPETRHNTISDCNIGVDLEWIEEIAIKDAQTSIEKA